MDENQENLYAGFWVRLSASLIDCIILTAITFPILYLTYGDSYWSQSSPFIMGNVDILVSWILPVIGTILFWHYWSGTSGKLALKLAVVDASIGKHLTVSRSIIRYFSYFVSALPLGLGFFWVS